VLNRFLIGLLGFSKTEVSVLLTALFRYDIIDSVVNNVCMKSSAAHRSDTKPIVAKTAICNPIRFENI